VESLSTKVVVDIAAGTGHNIALTEHGKMYSWGAGEMGELGIGPDALGNYKDAVEVHYNGRATQVSAGVVHSCAITREGRLVLWGGNNQCQLGYEKKLKHAYEPVVFQGVLEAKWCFPDPEIDAMQPDRVLMDIAMKYNYLQVECGSAITVAQVDKSPYLIIFGNNDHKAWGFPEVFVKDQP
jgi:alpha-tubulin suppressor-like RCC1 family protein